MAILSEIVATSNSNMTVGEAKEYIQEAKQESGESATTTEKSDKMGKDEFLKLMVTQLKNQNPLDPMDNKEFISQTAQFTSLEQMSNVNTNMKELLNMQKLTQVSGLVGKEVKALNSNSGEKITGKVEKVKMADSGPKLIINGNEYDMGSVNEILG